MLRVGMVNASKKKDLIIDAATMANPSALVHSQAIVFLLALSLDPKILKTIYNACPTNGAIKISPSSTLALPARAFFYIVKIKKAKNKRKKVEQLLRVFLV